jgi:hypothetical protein
LLQISNLGKTQQVNSNFQDEDFKPPIYNIWNLDKQDNQLHDDPAFLRQYLEPLSKHGEIGNGRSRGDNVTSTETKRGNNPTYKIRRLKRDNPGLADKVISGKIQPAFQPENRNLLPATV